MATQAKKRKNFTHIDSRGQARMVDVSDKPSTVRWARAAGKIFLNADILARLKSRKELPKGDVWALARSAGIVSAKRVSELVPLAHPLPLSHCSVEFRFEKNAVRAEAFVKTTAPTGVELESLMAVWGALLTIYDMIKALQKDAEIGEIVLLEKAGGRSGYFKRS